MLKIESAEGNLPTRIVTEEFVETLKKMQRGESVVVPLSRATAVYNAKKHGIPILVERKDGQVRVYKR